MDLSWTLPLGSSVNGGMPKEIYLSMPKKMRLPSALDLASLIREAGKWGLAFQL